MMNTIIAAALFFASTSPLTQINLGEGAVVCMSRQSAMDYYRARDENNTGRTEWLLTGACAVLDKEIPDQQVIASERNVITIRMVSGRWSKTRYVVGSGIVALAGTRAVP